MTRPAAPPTRGEAQDPRARLDDFLAAFEAARARDARTDPAAFLPPREHPLYLEVLRELVRVDLELGWGEGSPRPLEEYAGRFPELLQDRASLNAIAFEEYRLRRGAGENPAPADYERHYGVSVAGWPPQRPAEGGAGPRESARAARASFAVDATTDYLPGAETADQNPAAGFPEVGEGFLGFRLVGELGRGAIGRVFLARQAGLADRLVALKVAPASFGESQTLAQLQHTHIVPIYSVHAAGPLQAVCMPYFGRTTLADVLHDLSARPSLPQSGVELLATLSPPAAKGSHRESQEPAELPPVASQALRGLSYVEAVLWLGRCLADGLGHAHERGILHHDLKPANVLLTDEGQPMLLDFNLAEDTKRRDQAAEALVGGTLPYMAPEQLEALRGGRGGVDARGDLFSLGVLLFELLTRQPPFPARPVPRPELPGGDVALDPLAAPGVRAALAEMLRDRGGPPPSARRLNRAVSPAVDAIVRHCLEPDPRRRYQSARDLQEDLQRQLDRLPLRHAREPSLRERARKWLHRHPRLPLRLLAGATAVLLGLALALGVRSWRLARSEQALTALEGFRDDQRAAQTALSAPGDDPDQHARGQRLCRQALARFNALQDPNWRDGPLVAALPAGEPQRLRREAGELLLLLARAHAWPEASAYRDDAARQDELRTALALNRKAEACFAEGRLPPALWLQRADLHRQLGEWAEAESCRARSAGLTPQTPQDYFLLAREHAAAGRHREALPLVRKATQEGPENFWAWFLLGNCYDELGNDLAAVRSYSSCVGLSPKAPAGYFNRGLAHLRHKDFAEALADMNRIIELRKDFAEVHVNRALALQGLGRYGEAVESFTQALRAGASPARIYFMRSRARQRAGDHEGARRDHAEGLRREPADEKSWVARGLARRPTDPAGALADYERALALNPRSRAALQSKASVLAERLNRPQDALRVLDRLVALYPDYVPARSGRGVVLARLGRRDAALADARASLARDKRPLTVYQIACIYALTSRSEPADRGKALALLTDAVRQGFGANLLAGDPDLNALRGQPDFQRLSAAAAMLYATPTAMPPAR